MQIKGIKRGNIIEISENPNIPDGSEVLMEVREVSRIRDEERLKRLHQVFGAWKYETELGEIFAEIDTPLVDRLLEKAKELTRVSAELAEIIDKIEKERQIDRPQNFWEALQKFRQENNLEAAGIEPEVFEGVRDLSPGREVIL
ncbi:MAG: hypothetical protein WCD53_04600 [Microcoleus sp.]